MLDSAHDVASDVIQLENALSCEILAWRYAALAKLEASTHGLWIAVRFLLVCIALLVAVCAALVAACGAVLLMSQYWRVFDWLNAALGTP